MHALNNSTSSRRTRGSTSFPRLLRLLWWSLRSWSRSWRGWGGCCRRGWRSSSSPAAFCTWGSWTRGRFVTTRRLCWGCPCSRLMMLVLLGLQEGGQIENKWSVNDTWLWERRLEAAWGRGGLLGCSLKHTYLLFYSRDKVPLLFGKYINHAMREHLCLLQWGGWGQRLLLQCILIVFGPPLINFHKSGFYRHQDSTTLRLICVLLSNATQLIFTQDFWARVIRKYFNWLFAYIWYLNFKNF